MDYPCGKFGSGFMVWTNTQTHTERNGWTLYSRDCRRRE